MNRSTTMLVVAALAAVVVVIGATALGATIQVGGIAALKTSPLWVNASMILSGLLGIGVAGNKLRGEPRVVEKIVERRVTVPATPLPPLAGVVMTGQIAPCSTGNPSASPSSFDSDCKTARNALDTLLWFLHKNNRFNECESAANTFQKAIYGEVKNESSVQPPAVKPVSKPAATTEPVMVSGAPAPPVTGV